MTDASSYAFGPSLSDRPELARWIVRSTTDGLWVFDHDGRTTWSNERLAEILGRTPEEMRGLSVFDTLDEVGKRQFREHLAALAADGQAQENLECSLLRKDGSRIWALASHSPLVDDTGMSRGWLHRLTELTERKQLLDQVNASEQMLAEAQAIAKVGSWEWDISSDLVTWSDEMYRIHEVVPQQFEATYESFLEFVHPDERERVNEVVTRAISETGSFEVETRIRKRGGAEAWIRGRGKVLYDEAGRPLRVYGTSQDVTDSVRVTEELALASTRMQVLQALTSAANEASSLADAVEYALVQFGRHTSWAPRGAYRVLDDGGVRPMPLSGLPAVASPVAPHVERAVREGGYVWDSTSEPDGTTIGLLAVPVVVEDRVVCVIEFATAPDLTISVETGKAIGQVAAQLARVAEREQAAARLGAARDAAMRASRMKSDFLATMSHEIRTPLNGVIGLTDLLLRTRLDTHQRRLADGIDRAGRTLLSLVNDILDLSKIEAGMLELEAVDFDVREVVAQVTGLLAEQAGPKGVELVVACDPAVPTVVRGDSVRLGQVLTNLISNAVKFTEHGEVVVTVGVRTRTETGVILHVEVRDTGIGIEQEAQERLFDAFTQADSSTTRQFGGTGLGLTIARQLVQALDGEIGVTSRVGEGSTFWFTASFGLGRTSDRPGLDASMLRGTRALVVDDNATNRFVLRQQLEVWGFEVEVAATAGQAISLLRRGAEQGSGFDVTLLDLCMPGTDGLGLAALVRSDPRLAELPLVLLTSVGRVDEAAARRLGIGVCLDKPVPHTDLLAGVARALGLARREREAQTPSPAVAGGTVLVVEDNPVNHAVAGGMLEVLGYSAAVARDGVEAVRALAGDHEYVAVLMDVRMPRLDGYEATREIRRNEPPGRRVPIIAMTASAIEGERERCLAAGMDDFLVKPVDLELLGPTLRRWTQCGSDGEEPREPRPEVPAGLGPVRQHAATEAVAAESDDVLDRARLRVLEDLQPGDPTMLHRLVDSFVGSAQTDLANLLASAVDRDQDLMFQLAHRLKGRALNLGLPGVARVSGEIEGAAERAELEAAAALTGDLVREVDAALAALRRVRAGGL